MGKKRHLEQKINNLTGLFPVVGILGPRQCGKTTLVKEAYSDWKYYDLERPDDYQLITNDPLSFFQLNTQKVIIDEAQIYPQLFSVLRSIVDEKPELKGRYILTGSSSPSIVKGLNESLAGRVAIVEMAPFKVSEYLEKPLGAVYSILTSEASKLDEIESLEPVSTLNSYMKLWYKGGFPAPSIAKEQDFYQQWMDQYIQSYINRDVRSLFPKLNIHKFRRFLSLLSQFSGHQLNMSEMSRSLETSVTTIRDYLDIVHQTFIWRNLAPFEKNQLKKVQKSYKGMFRDQGILHYFLKLKTLDDLLVHPVAGHSFESFVVEEIIRGLSATMATQLDFSYYRTVDKSEVDLVIDSQHGLIPIEIKLASTVSFKQLKGLRNLIDDMNLDLGIVVNRGKRVERLTEKIIQIPINFW